MQFSSYSPAALRAAPKTQMLVTSGGRYQVSYQAFSHPANRRKTPVMFLGGAFQSFSSFRSEVERVLTTHPVVLADFPSQGSNEQLAPELALNDYAELIEHFCQQTELQRVIMLGVSYGSAMATLFATAFPQRVERLLLSGITCFRRDTLITLLEDSLQLLSAGEMDAFASTAVCNLINHNRLQETRVSPTYRRLLYRQIARLNNNERQRYEQNTRRLLDFPGFTEYPRCPVLIATGEYDNFTLPAENAAVARQCENATFAVIHNADHLAQFEQKDSAGTLFHRFMCGEAVDNIDGVTVCNASRFASQDQRLQPRLRPLNQPYRLLDYNNGQVHSVRIRNIHFAGCELEVLHSDLSLNSDAQELWLELPQAGCRYHVHILERQRRTLRCLIIQRDLKDADRLLQYLGGDLLLMGGKTEDRLNSQPA